MNLELSRCAAMVRSAYDWSWSSYRATAGLAEKPDWLTVDWLLSAFGKRRGPAREAYRHFVSGGRNRSSPWLALKQQLYLGDEAFVESMQAKIQANVSLNDVPLLQQRPPPMPLERYKDQYRNRNKAIAAAYASGGYSMKEIGACFELHYSMVSRIIRGTHDSKFKT